MYIKAVGKLDNPEYSSDENEEEKGLYHEEATVKLYKKTYNKLKVIVKKKEKDIKHTINSMVSNYVAREELFEIYRPFLYIVTVKDASLFIKDEKHNILVEVVLRYKDQKTNDSNVVIWCNACDTDYCVHTAFALASNELGQLELKIRRKK